MNDKVKIIGAALLCVALNSAALTLGRMRGAALIGQPLDITVQVQLDSGEDASSMCFEADVFHADTRQDASHVRVFVETSTQPNTANVRVSSTSVVDEPMVTVYLRTGCGQKTSRRYVLLADLPSEASAAATMVSAVKARPLAGPPAEVSTKALAAGDTARHERLLKTNGLQHAERADTVTKTALEPVNSPPAHKRTPREEKNKTAPQNGLSRLKLDPLELLSDRVANLDSFMTFEPPEDAARSLQRIQALEATVKAGQVLAAKNDASLAELTMRLKIAESERYPAGLLYGLIGLVGLVLACLAAVAFLWHRQRQRHSQNEDRDWWKASALATNTADSWPTKTPPSTTTREPEAVTHAVHDVGVPAMSALSELASLSGNVSNVDVNLTEMSESTFGDFMLPVVGHPDSLQSQRSVLVVDVAQASKPARTFNSDAVLDIRQQADFFVSLGQTDRAVRILQKKIEESQEPNPFFYLDLLDIYHSLSLKVDFQQFREDFNLLFCGKVPEFALFKQEGKGLDLYPDVLLKISALWPSKQVLTVIESYIFQVDRAGKIQALDLAAFRDLLLLHSVAQNLVSAATSNGVDPLGGAKPTAAAPPASELDLDLSETPLAPVPNSGNFINFDLTGFR